MKPNEERETCFDILRQLDGSYTCKNKSCEFNSYSQSKSCAIVALLNEESGRLTLQEVGNIFDLSRMRICQIEKKVVKTLTDAHT